MTFACLSFSLDASIGAADDAIGRSIATSTPQSELDDYVRSLKVQAGIAIGADLATQGVGTTMPAAQESNSASEKVAAAEGAAPPSSDKNNNNNNNNNNSNEGSGSGALPTPPPGNMTSSLQARLDALRKK